MPPSYKDCSNWVGPTAATCTSISALALEMPPNVRKYAEELVALAPDVILAVSQGLGPLLQATRTIPIVFTIVPDLVGAGFVELLSRPGGNATGFLMLEYSFVLGKWLELLKEIAPSLTRAAVLRDFTTRPGSASSR